MSKKIIRLCIILINSWLHCRLDIIGRGIQNFVVQSQAHIELWLIYNLLNRSNVLSLRLLYFLLFLFDLLHLIFLTGLWVDQICKKIRLLARRRRWWLDIFVDLLVHFRHHSLEATVHVFLIIVLLLYTLRLFLNTLAIYLLVLAKRLDTAQLISSRHNIL